MDWSPTTITTHSLIQRIVYQHIYSLVLSTSLLPLSLIKKAYGITKFLAIPDDLQLWLKEIINLYHKVNSWNWGISTRAYRTNIFNVLETWESVFQLYFKYNGHPQKRKNFWYVSPVSSGTKVATVLVNINLMRCLPWEVFVIPNKQNNNVPTIFCLVLINDTCVWYHFRMTLTFLPSGIKSKYADSKLNSLIDCHCSTKTQWLTR